MGDVIHQKLEQMLGRIERVSEDRHQLVEDLLEKEATGDPLTPEEAQALIDKVVGALREDAKRQGDRETVERIDAEKDEVVRELLSARGAIAEPSVVVELKSSGSIKVEAVQPTPIFHERPIPMMSGFVPLDAIQLWDGNERLDVHLEQFRRIRGHDPGPQELMEMMTSRMDLPGLEDEDDQFEVLQLARSIAANGMRRPPIIGRHGTLYDGNRRVAAAHVIRSSREFSSEQKGRVDELFVWQLTEHSTPDDVERLLMSMNFEDDLKEPWPEYVKARKVAAEWKMILASEDPPPGQRRAAQLKKELSQRFALGPDTTTVNRYIKMVQGAEEFETYLTEERGEDASAVKHAASRYFQYFDELNKGVRTGGVAWTLGRDDELRHLVFDLLYEGKFRNWTQVRKLKHVPEHEEAVQQLIEARSSSDPDEAQKKVELALSLGETNSPETRVVGANARIKSFTDWLSKLPLGAFRNGKVSEENAERLLVALADARRQAEAVLGEERVRELTGDG